jgi:sarcosine oxidase subunit alpha
MSGHVRIVIDGLPVEVPERISVAAALLGLERPFRRSVGGKHRAAVCGMGVCFECRVGIDGLAQQRACQVTVREGMRVDTDA